MNVSCIFWNNLFWCRNPYGLLHDQSFQEMRVLLICYEPWEGLHGTDWNTWIKQETTSPSFTSRNYTIDVGLLCYIWVNWSKQIIDQMIDHSLSNVCCISLWYGIAHDLHWVKLEIFWCGGGGSKQLINSSKLSCLLFISWHRK